MKLKVRVIRTYEVPVTAEYGDTDTDLLERAQAAVTDESKYAETAVLLPQGD